MTTKNTTTKKAYRSGANLGNLGLWDPELENSSSWLSLYVFIKRQRGKGYRQIVVVNIIRSEQVW